MSNRTYTCDKPGCFACYEMNRQKAKPFRKSNWTDLEIEYLLTYYKWHSIEKISKFLNRSPYGIWWKLHELNKKAA